MELKPHSNPIESLKASLTATTTTTSTTTATTQGSYSHKKKINNILRATSWRRIESFAS